MELNNNGYLKNNPYVSNGTASEAGIKQLEELRKTFEGKFPCKALVVDVTGTVLSVCEMSPGKYMLLRYFGIAGSWQVSGDGLGKNVDEMLDWLNDPRALR